MAKLSQPGNVLLDINNPVFQENLFGLQKPDRHSAIETLNKLRQMTWSQVYAGKGLHWEKIASAAPPPGIAAIYALRITQSRREAACRDGGYMRFLTAAPDHDATYGKK